jgi:hypothetical protein
MKRFWILFALLIPTALCAVERAPDAKVGTPYNYQVKFVTDPKASCALYPTGSPGVFNAFPAGLNFNQPATITGTPTKAGVYQFTVSCEQSGKPVGDVIQIRVVK